MDLEQEARATQFEKLESDVTIRIDEIRARAEGLELASEEASGISFFGLIRFVGGFIRSPFDWFIEQATERILEEVNDGLNR